MERRDFIIKSGTILTASSFVSMFPSALFGNYLSKDNRSDKIWNKRPDPNNFDQPIMKAIAFGINAPNPHNTQPWKFKILSDTEMLLFVDENNLLPSTDPPARQIHMGCGCFTETLKIGASSMGYDTQIDFLPEGEYAYSEIGLKPAAKITIIKEGNTEIHPLFDYLYKRQTNRKIYKGDLITNEEIDKINKIAIPSSSELIFLNTENEMQDYLDVFKAAFEIECRTYATHDETRSHWRFSENERAKKRDGISIPQGGLDGLIGHLIENSLKDGDKEIWHSEDTIRKTLKSINKGIDSSKGIVFFKTSSNFQLDWLKTGQDYTRFNLSLTKLNLQIHPYNQVIQEYYEMNEIRKKFNNMIGCSEPAKIQIIARMGRASQSYISYRKHVNDKLI